MKTLCEPCPTVEPWKPQPLPKQPEVAPAPVRFGKRVVFIEKSEENYIETLELLSRTKNRG